MWIFLALIPVAHCGLLGAGVGEGSCAAAPYRTPSNQLKWPRGCPGSHPCCSEYGYCQTKNDWWAKKFRDCNGESNGIALPYETIQAEAQFAQGGGVGGHSGGGGWPSNGNGGVSGGSNNIGCGSGGCNSGYSNGGSTWMQRRTLWRRMWEWRVWRNRAQWGSREFGFWFKPRLSIPTKWRLSKKWAE
eukprot:TRINITY_DN8154_c0_g1_i1.p1 TRINITY_DN8154_c0_g1~~TRINITY_DN8154_c0_g1_i1.p1  ORF type:complete len:188 (-),score=34.13 TRINITY_DN8154_c0_g1_i1:235-798(-)